MLYPNIVDDGTAMQRICKNCRYVEVDTEGGIIKEVIMGGGASAKNKILDDNEFIQYDQMLCEKELLGIA